MNKRKATVYTVAEHAGVSIATVSRTLAGSRKVSPATRQRVMQAIEDLNFEPNLSARRLAYMKTETIALLQTPLRLKSGASTGFALGWKVDIIPFAGKQARLVRHRASLLRGRASLSVFPELGLVIAVMSNHQHYLVESFAEKVAEAFAR